MAFELFTKYGKGNRPSCSIRASGQIGFNQGAVRVYGLRDGYAELYYDREMQRIGVKFFAFGGPSTCRFRVTERNAFISGRSFLHYYGIDYRGKSRKYAVESEAGLLVIDLKRPLLEATDEG